MEVQTKNILDKKLLKEFEIFYPKELLSKNVNDYIEKVKGTYNLKGFRKGQVPANIIKEKHGEAILADELEKLLKENIKKIVKDHNLKLALEPKVDIKKIALEQDLTAKISFELYPELPEIELAKIKLTKREAELSDVEISEEIKKFAKYFCKWSKQEQSYKAKLNDAVKIDYVGKIDGEEFEGGSAKDYQLELGSKSFIDDFEEQLVGKKAGDKVTVKVKFPKDYHSEKFAGKSAEFAVNIHEILCAELPEITDEFTKQNLGLENAQTLQDNIKKELEKRNEEMSVEAFKIELFEFLNKKYDFDLPQGLIEAQTKSLWQDTEEELKTNPNKFKNEKEKNKAYAEKEELAKKMIRCGMILSKIAEEQKIEVKKEDFDAEIQKILSRYRGQEKQVIDYYQKNPQALENIRLTLIEAKAIEFIISQNSIEKKKTSFKDFEKFYKKILESLK